MDILQKITSTTKVQTPTFDFFFKRMADALRKGRGFSVFNADQACITAFAEACKRKGHSPLTITLSTWEGALPNIPEKPGFIILIQDLSFPEFLDRAALAADQLVFPLWFRRIPICFFTKLDGAAYRNHRIVGEDIHRNFSAVINALLAEQVFTLLERANYQFASPDDIKLSGHQMLFTPVEEKLKQAFEAGDLSYQPQARVGRHTVDFLVAVQDKKVIVDCDGKAYQEPAAEDPRGKALASTGHPLCRFSGSDIFADVDKCIEKIRTAPNYTPRPAYTLDTDLDPGQEAAVRAVSGPIRVLAPAGSGKTKTLVNRILHLLNQGIASEKILALAFNKKARDEMQERLERKGVHGVEVRTFHSFGYEIVREGLPWSFDGAAHRKTSRELMRSAIQEHTELPALRNSDPLDAFLAGLRKAKMELPALPTVTVEYGDRIYPLEPIFYSYLKKQLDRKFLDFDDMIYLAIRLLLDNRTLRHTYQSRFEFVLVDEFQDLNQAQLLLLQIISLPENNIFAVGDDDQMIYGFRGAEVRHIVEFDKRFPIATNHILNTNYRSSRMIVRHSGWLIRHNGDRVPKDIRPRKNAQAGRFEVSGHLSLFEQAEHAAQWLVNHKKENNLDWRDYAVLYRYNAYQFPVAVALDKLGVPHTGPGGDYLFRSAVGKDIYSYLQIILFPAEARPADFDRVLKRPNQYFTNQLIAQARDWQSFLRLPETPNLRGWEQEKVTEFVRRFESATQSARTPDTSAADCLRALKTEFGLGEFYREQSRKSDDLDQAGDEVLLDVIIALAESYKTPLAFYQFLCKSIDDQQSEPGDHDENGAPEKEEVARNEVYLSTIHKAKGKEFRNVVYFNLSRTDEGSRPVPFMEEERRVAYVGATRSKDDLLVTFSSRKPADFLLEMALNPKFEHVEDEELQRRLTSSNLSLTKARVVLKQLEAAKSNALVRFHALAKLRFSQWPVWTHKWIWKIQNWRLDRAQAKVEGIDLQIKKQAEMITNSLLREIADIEEAIRMRAALGIGVGTPKDDLD
ncbi:MAG TPA: UvrD-helicase domain-containing protein [Anaerolineales bacterium]|nr:UvrD-helicase domain-containing protein [Anaerolineales bacterium]